MKLGWCAYGRAAGAVVLCLPRTKLRGGRNTYASFILLSFVETGRAHHGVAVLPMSRCAPLGACRPSDPPLSRKIAYCFPSIPHSRAMLFARPRFLSQAATSPARGRVRPRRERIRAAEEAAEAAAVGPPFGAGLGAPLGKAGSQAAAVVAAVVVVVAGRLVPARFV